MNNKTMLLAEERKSTNLSKFLRILRIQNDELLGDMANKIGIMPSYLSSIEANRRPLTPALMQKLVNSYNLDEKDQEKLENYIAEAARSVEVDLTHVRDESILPKYVDTALLFAKDLSTLGSAELDEIKKLLISFNREEKHNEKRDLYKS
ncbi:MAG: helix-turn-helix domain-containing protein [Treponema sp.]|nr:helix-turn-helix domain-containing protein [Treponema sp.]